MNSAPKTPENSSKRPADLSDSERRLYDIAEVELWRKHQHGVLSDLRGSAEPDIADRGYIDLFTNNIEESLDDFLKDKGIDKSSLNYDEIKDFYRNSSIDRIHDDEWYSSPASRGVDASDTVSGRDKAIGDIENRLKSDPEDENPEAEKALERLDELRKGKHEAFVARMKGSVFGKKRRELQQAYEDAEREYMVALSIQNKRAIADKKAELEAAGKTEDEVETELKEYSRLEARRIAKNDQEEQHRLLVEKSGKMGKFLEWYGNLSAGKKIAAGIGLSAVTIASGAGIGFAAGLFGGLVGAGIVTGAGTGLARGWAAARTFQLRKAELYRFPTHLEDFKIDEDDTASSENLHLKQRTYLEQVSQNQINQGEKVKRRAAWWALGSVAVGSTIGAGAHLIGDMDLMHAPGGQVQHWLAERGVKLPGDHTGEVRAGKQFDTMHNKPSTDSTRLPLPPDGSETKPPWPPQVDTIPNKPVKLWHGAPTEHVLQKLVPGMSDQDAYIQINELYDRFGGKGVFQGATLSEYEPNNIWINENSGSVKLTPQAEEYLERLRGGGNINETINQPPTPSLPELPSGVEQTIHQLTEQNASAVPANTIGGNEGWYQTFTELRQARVMDLLPAKYDGFLKEIGPQLAKIHYSDHTPVAYWDRFAHEWRMNSSPNGRLHPDAIRMIARLARRSDYGLAA